MIQVARAKAAPTPQVPINPSASRTGAGLKRDAKLSALDVYGCVEWFDYRKHPLEPETTPRAKDPG